ncbi:MAG TPA: DUF1361 domain-containing protein [Patescibacteria group bacterium]|nr:DUF1361 domain-containing protein [Patescibacteria group bacterium]
MDTLFNNLSWMVWNVVLAVLPVVFIILFTKSKINLEKIIFFVFWFLFLPNSIYLITDIQYLPGQINGEFYRDLLLIFEYLILVSLGIVTYFYALDPFIKFLKKRYKKHNLNYFIFVFNFLISFGVVLGKIQRAESWDVFIHPLQILSNVNALIIKQNELVFVIFFGIIINVIYFVRTSIIDQFVS